MALFNVTYDMNILNDIKRAKVKFKKFNFKLSTIQSLGIGCVRSGLICCLQDHLGQKSTKNKATAKNYKEGAEKEIVSVRGAKFLERSFAEDNGPIA